MSGSIFRRLAAALILAASAASSVAHAQQLDCRLFKVTAEKLDMYDEPRRDSKHVAEVNRNDVVCVAGDQEVGGRVWAFIGYQMEGKEQRKRLEGWAIKEQLEPATQADLAALESRRGGAEQRPRPESGGHPGTGSGTPPGGHSEVHAGTEEEHGRSEEHTRPEGHGSADREEAVRYNEQIKTGAVPVLGHSLEQLVTSGVPTFTPLEGLPESAWQKPCGSCHNWNRQSLCQQAQIYAHDPQMAMRKAHPYGGPEKIAMMKWAESGCQ